MPRSGDTVKGLAVVTLVIIAIHTCAETASAQESLKFLREHIDDVDSIWKWIGLVFFTIVLLYFDMALFPWLVPVVLAPIAVAAVLMPRVRASRLVRFGAAAMVLGWVPLMLVNAMGQDNALGFGFMFAFTMPIGFLAIVIGTLAAVVATVRARWNALLE